MSIKLMTQVWELDLPHPQLLVALALADHGNDDGSSIYPSLGHIAWKCGYSDRQVRRIVRELEAAGLLVKVADPTAERGVEYRMVAAAGKPKPPRGADKMSGGQNDRPDTTGQGGGHPDPPGADIAVAAEPSVEPSGNQTASSEAGCELDPEAIRLCRVLSQLMRQNDPRAKLPTEGSATRVRWVRDMRLLIADRDGDVAEVESVIRWAQADDFERANVLSPGKLRKRFSALLLKTRGGRPATRIQRTQSADPYREVNQLRWKARTFRVTDPEESQRLFAAADELAASINAQRQRGSDVA